MTIIAERLEVYCTVRNMRRFQRPLEVCETVISDRLLRPVTKIQCNFPDVKSARSPLPRHVAVL